MTVPEIIQDIEHGSVPADLRLASSTRALLHRLGRHRTIRQARDQIATSPEDALLYLERAERLYHSEAPEGYSHPSDLSIAAYLYLLSPIAGRGIQRFVNQVADSDRPDVFHASNVAQHFKLQVASATSSSRATLEQPTPEEATLSAT